MAAMLKSVNVGITQTIELGRQTVPTGIFKRPAPEAIHAGRLGLTGDVQLDRRHHGGPDKAVNVYPSEHYSYWSERLAGDLGPGSFGENFTTTGLFEEEVAIGDILKIGAALFQVTQPRQPCGKLAARHREPNLVRMVYESGRTGFYLRCLQPGKVQQGDAISTTERPADCITVLEALRIMERRDDAAAIERLLAIEALSEAWREEISQRSK
ncbi:MAG: MOSC domain-containing protein [Planctomycetales bacterium]|nr:MOSC domain-containing protein [Planctomycetales bacterium]